MVVVVVVVVVDVVNELVVEFEELTAVLDEIPVTVVKVEFTVETVEDAFKEVLEVVVVDAVNKLTMFLINDNIFNQDNLEILNNQFQTSEIEFLSWFSDSYILQSINLSLE